MGSVTPFFLYFALFFICITAEYTQLAQLYDGPTSDFKVVGLVGGALACGPPAMFVLTHTTTNGNCFYLLNATSSEGTNYNTTYQYELTGLGCPAELADAVSFACPFTTTASTLSCFALNPTLKKLVYLSPTGKLRSSKDIDLSFMINPTHWDGFLSKKDNNYVVYVVDSNNDVYQQLWAYEDETQIDLDWFVFTTIDASVTVKSITGFDTITFMIEADQLYFYSPYDGYAEPFGTGLINNADAISIDNYRNAYVYDASAQQIFIFDSALFGVNSNNISLETLFENVTSISSFFMKRQEIIAIAPQGIWSLKQPFSFGVTYINKTCDTVPGRISVTVQGGNFPYYVVSQPDGVQSVVNAPPDLISPVTVPLQVNAEFLNPVNKSVVLLDEGIINKNWVVTGDTTVFPNVFGWVDSSVIAPYTGDLSFEILLKPKAQFTLRCPQTVRSGCINASQHEYFEFALNVGNGGQHFKFFCNSYKMFFEPGDLPNNTWVHYKWHISSMAATHDISNNAFASCVIEDISPTLEQRNPLYIDAMNLIPYENPFPTRYVYVCDQCAVLYEKIIPYSFNPFRVVIEGDDVSCYPNTTTSDALSSNGVLRAVVTQGGKAPYKYTWRYGTGLGYNTSRVENRPIMNSNIVIYDNELNSSWTKQNFQAGLGSLKATKYVRSAPYSISFSPKDNFDTIYIQAFNDVQSVDFPVLEFYANGGDVGGQRVIMYAYKTSVNAAPASLTTQYLDLQEFELVPNKWVKIRMTIAYNPNAAVRWYDTIALYANVIQSPWIPFNTTQPTVYIDDISLLPRVPSVTVVDSNNCPATAFRAQVKSPEPLRQTVTINNAKCYGNQDGVVTVIMAGGKAPYVFEWPDSLDNDSVFAGKGESVVNFGVRDDNMCQYADQEVTILQPPKMDLEYEVQEPKCYGGTGVATAYAVGGIGSYTFNWVAPSIGVPNVLLRPTPAAVYMDAPSYPGVSIVGAKTICEGTGSHLNHTYIPSHSGYCSLALFTDSSVYSRLIGCEHCFAPDMYNQLVFWIFSTDQASLEGIELALTSASSNYSDPVPIVSFGTLVANQWSKVTIPYDRINGIHHPNGIQFNQTAATGNKTVLVDDIVVLTNTSAGAGFGVGPGFASSVEVRAAQYYLSIVDGNGCTKLKIINVTQPKELDTNYTTTPPTNDNDSDGTATVTAFGGTGPYTYEWVDLGINSTSGYIAGLSHGEHKVLVTDANGCGKEFKIFLNTFTPPMYVRAYNSKLSSGLAALVAIGLILSVFSAIMLYRYWVSFSTLGSFLSSMILVGCVLSFLSALVLLPEPTDALCTSFIWFLGVGFVLVYGCLFIKAWALYKVWRNAVKYQKAHLTPLYIVKCLCLAVTVEIIFLAVWTAVDPPKVHQQKTLNNSFERQCNTNNITFWIIFLAAKGAWLVFGAVLSVLTRNIAREINESTSIAYAIYNNVLLGAIAIPLALLLGEVPGGRLTVIVVIISLAFTFTMVVVFFKIWHSIMLPEKIIVSSSEMRSREKRNTASSTTRTSTSVSRASGKASSSDSGTDAAV